MWPLRWARFSRRPVEKLSSTLTSRPRSRSSSTRFEPMKPEPPVTRTGMALLYGRFPLCARPAGSEASAEHRLLLDPRVESRDVGVRAEPVDRRARPDDPAGLVQIGEDAAEHLEVRRRVEGEPQVGPRLLRERVHLSDAEQLRVRP